MRLSTLLRRPAPLQALLLLLAALCPLFAACNHYGNPSKAATQLAFGADMARRGLWSEALFRFTEAERADPQNAKVENNLGVALEASGSFDQALEHYRKALQLAPTDRHVRANYARFVEFYQGFKGKGKGAAGDSTTTSKSTATPPTTATGGATQEPPVPPPSIPVGGPAPNPMNPPTPSPTPPPTTIPPPPPPPAVPPPAAR